MQVIDPTTVTPISGAPVLPVAPLPASPTGTADRRSGGQDSRQQAGYSSSRFRAALDAATVAGFGRVSDGAETAPETAAPFQGTPSSRTSASSQELNAADTTALYQAVRAYTAGASASPAGSTSTAAEPAAPPSPTSIRQAQTAATRYAQSFFSVGGTFAARGDTLELSA
ncbi:MAG: hypothetical protein EPO08_10150, partial [Rhodospirillaceae bacterium]